MTCILRYEVVYKLQATPSPRTTIANVAEFKQNTTRMNTRGFWFQLTTEDGRPRDGWCPSHLHAYNVFSLYLATFGAWRRKPGTTKSPRVTARVRLT